ncbi:MAG: hypothetical protein HN757_09060, partial [Calditrichaeota bacterium]|jgi:hypothetical protein|nr:hypothetical protein [Calditrichota bacterium]
MLNKDSLAVTLDAINESHFSGKPVKNSESEKLSTWIASRQGLNGAYAGMFAPTEMDYRNGIRLFTGERITSGAATGHILGEEACRALILLDSPDENVKRSLTRASEGMISVLKNHESGGYTVGMFCCGTCTTAMWRHLNAGGLYNQEPLLRGGMRALKAHRDDNGRWKRFPFWHTSLVLSEMETSIAKPELEYIAPAIEKSVKYLRKDNPYTLRRIKIAETLLGKI